MFLLPPKLKVRLRRFLKKRRKRKYDPKQVLAPKFESSLAPFDYYKCIFVHIPKNAGISVSYTIFGNTGGGHKKISAYKKLFSKKRFNKYYKFTFVRNPWDRMVSTFFFLKNGGLTEKDKVWAENNLAEYKTFEEFVKGWLNEHNIQNSLHFQAQYCFLEDENGNIPLDFIGRFENLEEDFKIITKTLGINRSLKKTNTSNRDRNYKKYFNQETREIVAEVYKRDIELFNYRYE